eukprot:COSAG02_NODE_508_length_20916_cov_162.483691_20_plen_235_part_00
MPRGAPSGRLPHSQLRTRSWGPTERDLLADPYQGRGLGHPGLHLEPQRLSGGSHLTHSLDNPEGVAPPETRRSGGARPRGLLSDRPAHNSHSQHSLSLGSSLQGGGAHASLPTVGTDGGAEKQRGGPRALLRGFRYYSSGPRGWGGNAPPRFLDPRLAREHLRLGRAAQQHNQALKRFKRIGNRSAGGTAECCMNRRGELASSGPAPRVVVARGRAPRRHASGMRARQVEIRTR